MFFVFINLEERKQKNKYMNDLLKSMELTYERFEAIKPIKRDALKNDRLVKRIIDYLNDDVRVMRGIGLLGCYLSHRQVLEKYKNIKSEFLVVLEDDVHFTEKSIKLVEENIDFLQKNNLDWDILRSVSGFPKLEGNDPLLNNKIYKFDSINNQSRYNLDQKKNYFCGGTHFQVINMKNINKIINYLDLEYIYNIDSIYSTNKLNIYALKNEELDVRLHHLYKYQTNIPKI